MFQSCPGCKYGTKGHRKSTRIKDRMKSRRETYSRRLKKGKAEPRDVGQRFGSINVGIHIGMDGVKPKAMSWIAIRPVPGILQVRFCALIESKKSPKSTIACYQ